MTRATKTSAVLFAAALALTACGGGGDDTTDGGSGDAASGGSSSVALTGTDDLKYSETALSADAGTVTAELTCEPAVTHNFVVEEAGDTMVVECAAGATETGTIDLEAGDYTFYCSIPGHRAAGMEGTLTVG